MVIEALESRIVLASGLSVSPNIDISKMLSNETEPAITIDPTNPLHIFVLSNTDATGLFAGRSVDGGNTWTAKVIADGTDSLPSSCCDPSATFDNFGNLFIAYLNEKTNAVVVAVSTNDGSTFKALHVFAGDIDQPTVVTGSGSVWVNFSKNNVETVSGAAVTGLGLVSAFSAARPIPGGGGGNFGDIAIGPQGQVAVAFERPLTSPHAGKLYISVDPDGLGPQKFSTAVPFTRTHVGGFDFIPPQGTIRSIDAEVGLAYDNSGGPFNGRLYAVYTDQTSLPISNTDIFLRYSDNNGTRWSQPVLVNDDASGTSQFLPRISVDQTTGHVGLTWMDSRHDASTDKTGSTDGVPNDDAEAFAAVVTPLPSGLGVSANIQVASSPSNADDSDSTVSYGDYGSAAFFGGQLLTAWADNSNSTHQNPDGKLSSFDMYFAAQRTDSIASDLPATTPVPAGPPPSVKLTPKKFVAEGTDYIFQVLYHADLAVDQSSIQAGNLTVTGLNGYSQPAQVFRIAKSSDPSRVTVFYRITAPDTAWSFADNGLYTIEMLGSQVDDIGGQFIAMADLGTFTVAVKQPHV